MQSYLWFNLFAIIQFAPLASHVGRRHRLAPKFRVNGEIEDCASDGLTDRSECNNGVVGLASTLLSTPNTPTMVRSTAIERRKRKGLGPLQPSSLPNRKSHL
nr:hypothetical protein Iba_chr07dCG3470 [Ipomoea batatas]GMD60712.1 hypothetical protein Iba_chr12aCG13870 [Ipomoea batatas]GMD75859.1 hypothetical protein Iba_chr13bCG4760 [Ipomoea batatas]